MFGKKSNTYNNFVRYITLKIIYMYIGACYIILQQTLKIEWSEIVRFYNDILYLRYSTL